MQKTLLIGLLLLLCACQSDSEDEKVKESVFPDRRTLTLEDANRLVNPPLECIEIEYPNKLNQVISAKGDLLSPQTLHPAFYGCFDWHSAVHGHWSLVRLLKTFPDIEEAEKIRMGLLAHLSKVKIEGEIEYFENATNQGFERMYGWAWLLKLTDEVHSWDHPTAKVIEANLKPLAELISEKIQEFLPKLHYPIRVGTHTNTAFAMTMIFDYAVSFGDRELKEVVEKRARDYFLKDTNCPLSWEPSGYDFLSPCLEEANIMRRILPKNEFKTWFAEFLPKLLDKNFELEPGIVSDRKDGHLVHLDGLNYSRAWCLYGIAETLPEYRHLIRIGNDHINHSLPNLTDGNYEGGHWLASFALLTLTQ